MGVRYSAEQWAEWVAEQAESGLSVADFCDEVGVTTNSFYRWRTRLAAADETSGSQTAQALPVSRFVPLAIVGSPPVEIDLPCGAVVRVPADESVLRGVLRVLLDVGAEADGGAAC